MCQHNWCCMCDQLAATMDNTILKPSFTLLLPNLNPPPTPYNRQVAVTYSEGLLQHAFRTTGRTPHTYSSMTTHTAPKAIEPHAPSAPQALSGFNRLGTEADMHSEQKATHKRSRAFTLAAVSLQVHVQQLRPTCNYTRGCRESATASSQQKQASPYNPCCGTHVAATVMSALLHA